MPYLENLSPGRSDEGRGEVAECVVECEASLMFPVGPQVERNSRDVQISCLTSLATHMLTWLLEERKEILEYDGKEEQELNN